MSDFQRVAVRFDYDFYSFFMGNTYFNQRSFLQNQSRFDDYRIQTN